MAVAKWSIDVPGVTSLNSAFKALEGFEDLPYAREALLRIQGMAVAAVNARAPGSLAGKAVARPIRGRGTAMYAGVKVNHPAAKQVEFGRKWYYRGFTKTGPIVGGRRTAKRGDIKGSGFRFRSTGTPERPYVGIKHGGHAIGAIGPESREIMAAALAREWERLAAP